MGVAEVREKFRPQRRGVGGAVNEGEGRGTAARHERGERTVGAEEFLEQREQRVFVEGRGFEGIVKFRARRAEIAGAKVCDEPWSAAGPAVERGGEMRELLVSPGRRDAKSGMDEQDKDVAQAREKIERCDVFAAARRQRGAGLEKKGHVRAEGRGEFVQLRAGQRRAEKFVQPEQRRGRIAAATAESGSHRNAFFEVQADAVVERGGFQKRCRRAMHEIGRIHRKLGIAARQRDAAASELERQLIAKLDRVHDGFEFMKTVRSPAKNIQQEVDLAG